MIRGTTPTFRLTITGGVDLHAADHIYITIKQGPVTLELTDYDLTADNVLECYLTQEQSLQLNEGMKSKIQVNWTYPEDNDGIVKRAATVVKEITIGEQLLRKVLPSA